MDEAVRIATEQGAYGFFYHQQDDSYQIVGLYQTEGDMLFGTRRVDCNARGAIGTLMSTSFCEPPAPYVDGNTYPGDSSD